MIGPREAPRLWSRHIANCAVIAPAFVSGSTLADIGSGAGLPGIVLGIARPDLAVTLVEPLLRRTTFLVEVVERLALTNVEVVRARAEELHGRRQFASVTSRAVAPLDRLVRWSWPLVAPGGQLVAIKGERAPAEVVEHAGALRALVAAGPAEVVVHGQETLTPPTTVVRIQSTGDRREG